MRTHRFGSREVSVIGLGTADFGGRIAESLAREFLDAYIGIKGNFIDTARVYGDFATPKNGESEKVIAFCDKIMMRDEDCDFRKFVRKWTITQRDRIRDKKSYIVMSYDYYVDRYAKLLDKRKEKKKAKVKAAANTAKTNLKSPD